jgi:N-acetylneuraminate synthase/N,N'-diacetyllegionaminate synthase
MTPIKVGNRLIGPGAPCFIAAEVGINHNGDMQLARRAIDAAADAGADGVKFQNFRTEDFISDRSLTYEYVSQGKTVVESQWDMFKRNELKPEDLEGLARYCERRGVVFFSTPSSRSGIDDLVRVGAPLLKNGSDYLVNLPLIRAMAQSGLPVVLSTGMATLGEIEDAVNTFRGSGGRDLVLLHCTSAYPTPDADTNLRKIPTLARAFDCPVGFSDHTWGTVAAGAAIALGACFVEKHFTIDRNLPGPDHRFSSDPAELRALVETVRRTERCLGTESVGPTPSEAEGRQQYRLSCVAADDFPSGKVLQMDDVAFRRPATGLPPKFVDRLIGRKLAIAVKRGHPLSDADFSA